MQQFLMVYLKARVYTKKIQVTHGIWYTIRKLCITSTSMYSVQTLYKKH